PRIGVGRRRRTSPVRRIVPVLALLAAVAAVPPALAALPGAKPTTGPGAMAGVGVADATWNVGSNAGQYASDRDLSGELQGGPFDPNLYSVKDQPSYGVQSRLSMRALVVQGADGTKVALVKADD